MTAPHHWDPVAANNASSDPNADLRPGRPANTVLGAIRGLMATAARARDDAMGGSLVAVLAPNNVYTLATNEGLIDPASIAGGGQAKITRPFTLRFSVNAPPSNVAANPPSLVIDGAPSMLWAKGDTSLIAEGDIVSGKPYEILGDYITSGTVTRARTLDLLPSDIAGLSPTGYPIGGILAFTGLYVPTGFLVANGALLSRASYPKLWAHAQASGSITDDATWGSNLPFQGLYSIGDGATSFRIPALQGVFLRGLDFGRGLDPGRTIGAIQSDLLRAHNHPMANGGAPITLYGGPNSVAISSGNFNNGYFADSIAAAGGAETRPVNAAYPFLIRAY